MKMTTRLFTIALLFGALAMFTGCTDRSPEAVCEHFVGLDDGGDEKVKECTEEVKEMKKEMEEDEYNKFADCVLDADSSDAAEDCI